MTTTPWQSILIKWSKSLKNHIRFPQTGAYLLESLHIVIKSSKRRSNYSFNKPLTPKDFALWSMISMISTTRQTVKSQNLSNNMLTRYQTNLTHPLSWLKMYGMRSPRMCTTPVRCTKDTMKARRTSCKSIATLLSLKTGTHYLSLCSTNVMLVSTLCSHPILLAFIMTIGKQTVKAIHKWSMSTIFPQVWLYMNSGAMGSQPLLLVL